MRITVNQQSKTPYFRQIANQLKGMILRGEIPQGTTLPSERVMAKLCGVHRNTVIKAYYELKADGFIASSQGKGYQTVYRKEEENHRAEQVHWSRLIRNKVQDMDSTYDLLFSRFPQEGKISFAGGLVAPDVYSREAIASVHLCLRDYGGNMNFYQCVPYQGMEHLRAQLAIFLQGKGIRVGARQIQVTASTAQSISFLSELLLDRGDAVLIEEPMTPDLYRFFSVRDIKVVPVPIDGEGIVVESIEALISQYQPKLLYVNSSYHDPRGVITSLARRKELLRLSWRFGIPIVESDASSELYFEEPQIPSYAALDQTGSVIYLYSFDMTFLPGIRIACVAAPRPVIDYMNKIIAFRMAYFGRPSQLLLYHCLKTEIYQKTLKQMRISYREKRDLMYELLKPLFAMGASCNLPQGGIYLWLRLPDDMVRVETLRRCAEKKDVLFIPGFVFFPFGTGGEQYIRLNYSYPSKEEIQRGIPLLIEAVNEAKEEK